MTDDLALASATTLSALYRSRQASPVEATKAVLAQIDALNPLLNTFCWLDPDAALASARASEERWQRGAPKSGVDGIPTTVKDLSIARGWPTRRGSLAIGPRGPWLEDSPSVARMREGGAVILGKTCVPEFGAMGLTVSPLCGVTRNPWNLAKTPGGSSGGAAASLAAGMGTLALASDASGSIRGPASFTGVFGLKTTFGSVPDYPSSYLGSKAVVGPMARTVADAALCMSVITRPDARDSYALPTPTDDFVGVLERGIKGLRVAYSPTLGFGDVDPEVAAIVESGVKLLRELGAEVDLVEHVFDDPSACNLTISSAGMANMFRVFGFTEADKKLISPHLVERAEFGAKITAVDYLAAREAREALGARMRQFHERYDLLVTTTLATPALGAEEGSPVDPRYRKFKGVSHFGPAFNLTKQPAASVPVGLTAEGLPVGMQVVGPLYGDALVMRLCHAVEMARPFAQADLARLRAMPVPSAVPRGIASMMEAMPEVAAA
jgi:aspartyl-tRNA(Asn)/glutamyl-tRNA(Gln) amidotransferase subunit A